MQNLRKSKQEPTKRIDNSSEETLDFILSGIGCNCLVFLFTCGLFDKLIKNKLLNNKEIEKCSNPTAVKAALLTLEKCGVLEREKGNFRITSFGIALSEYIGLIRMLFDGYGDLMAMQNQIARKKIQKPSKLIRGTAISQSAVFLARNTIDPILLKEFSELKFSGTICDLGCGYARMLSQVCEATGNPGLGFDSEPKVVAQTKKLYDRNKIHIELGDISKLHGVWEDVVILMQCHVFHDFTPSKKCINILNSFLTNFPNLKYFFYIDSVAPANDSNEILPGFDYVHGLLGISPRTHEETLQMFDQSNYSLLKEVAIPGLPNTFLWVLSPNREQKQKRLK
jgi:hypothetical protein